MYVCIAGNDYIHALTSNRQYKLRVDLEDFEDESRYAAYSTFAVSSEADKYKFILGTYNGTAGDSLRHHANTGFSTKDRDNDRTNTTHCALTLKGGWWYGSCTGTNMNGVYHKGSKSPGDRYLLAVVARP
ncbi:Tenascin-R [Lamellibrachia satsuma]|nr:Tenascin-R [Lamellibrachia satsuma]